MDDTEPCRRERIFHFFSRLPAELRFKIWALNLPGPRVVSVRCGSGPLSSSSSSSSFMPSYHPGGGGSCLSSAPIPANLHVCHESRSEALRRYRLSFGIARQPGRVFFDPDKDILYFGPRDGFMASEAQLRTVLTLCCPEELRRVRKVAINDALFWIYENNSGEGSRSIAFPSSTPVVGPPSPSCEYTATSTNINSYYDGRQQRQQQRHRPEAIGGGGLAHSTIAMSLLVDTLQLLRARLPEAELIFVPRDENPLYSGDCCLVEPAMVQSRMARQIREAMAIVFDGDGNSGPDSSSSAPGGRPQQRRQQRQEGHSLTHVGHCGDDDAVVPWRWRIMTLSAYPDPPVYGRRVLGWEDDQPQQMLEVGWERSRKDGHERLGRYPNHKRKREVVTSASSSSSSSNGGGGGTLGLSVDTIAGPPSSSSPYSSSKEGGRRGIDVEVARLSALQQCVRKRFMQMEMGVCI